MTRPKKIEDPRPSHVEDLRLVSEALWKQSARQGWCTEFESYINVFNNNLRVTLPMPQPTLAVQWYLNFTWTADVPGTTKADAEAAKAALVQKLKDAQKSGDFAVVMEIISSANVEHVNPYDMSVRTCGIPRDTSVF